MMRRIVDGIHTLNAPTSFPWWSLRFVVVTFHVVPPPTVSRVLEVRFSKFKLRLPVMIQLFFPRSSLVRVKDRTITFWPRTRFAWSYFVGPDESTGEVASVRFQVSPADVQVLDGGAITAEKFDTDHDAQLQMAGYEVSPLA